MNDEHMHKLTTNTGHKNLLLQWGEVTNIFNLGFKKVYHTHLGGCETRELNHPMLVDK